MLLFLLKLKVWNSFVETDFSPQWCMENFIQVNGRARRCALRFLPQKTDNCISLNMNDGFIIIVITLSRLSSKTFSARWRFG